MIKNLEKKLFKDRRGQKMLRNRSYISCANSSNWSKRHLVASFYRRRNIHKFEYFYFDTKSNLHSSWIGVFNFDIFGTKIQICIQTIFTTVFCMYAKNFSSEVVTWQQSSLHYFYLLRKWKRLTQVEGRDTTILSLGCVSNIAVAGEAI